jgi:hypothetical protein
VKGISRPTSDANTAGINNEIDRQLSKTCTLSVKGPMLVNMNDEPKGDSGLVDEKGLPKRPCHSNSWLAAKVPAS